METDQSSVRKTLFCQFGIDPPGSPLVCFRACVIKRALVQFWLGHSVDGSGHRNWIQGQLCSIVVVVVVEVTFTGWSKKADTHTVSWVSAFLGHPVYTVHYKTKSQKKRRTLGIYRCVVHRECALPLGLYLLRYISASSLHAALMTALLMLVDRNTVCSVEAGRRV